MAPFSATISKNSAEFKTLVLEGLTYLMKMIHGIFRYYNDCHECIGKLSQKREHSNNHAKKNNEKCEMNVEIVDA